MGELLENSYRVGLLRMERAIKERMSSIDIDTVIKFQDGSTQRIRTTLPVVDLGQHHVREAAE